MAQMKLWCAYFHSLSIKHTEIYMVHFLRQKPHSKLFC